MTKDIKKTNIVDVEEIVLHYLSKGGNSKHHPALSRLAALRGQIPVSDIRLLTLAMDLKLSIVTGFWPHRRNSVIFREGQLPMGLVGLYHEDNLALPEERRKELGLGGEIPSHLVVGEDFLKASAINPKYYLELSEKLAKNETIKMADVGSKAGIYILRIRADADPIRGKISSSFRAHYSSIPFSVDNVLYKLVLVTPRGISDSTWASAIVELYDKYLSYIKRNTTLSAASHTNTDQCVGRVRRERPTMDLRQLIPNGRKEEAQSQPSLYELVGKMELGEKLYFTGSEVDILAPYIENSGKRPVYHTTHEGKVLFKLG